MRMSCSRGSILWAGLAVAALTGPVQGQEELKMKIRMTLEGDRFLAQESILLQVSLENTSSAIVEVPDPEDLRNPQFSYTISGPAYPRGVAFTPRVSLREPNVPSLLKMRPGDKLEAQLPLNMMFPLSQPGPYTLTSHYQWGGQSESFAPISFSIERGILKSARVMADDGFQTAIRQRVLALTGETPRLYQFLFNEQRPGEIRLMEMIRAAAAPQSALQAVAPWANMDRADLLFARFGWQSPGVLGIESGPPEGSVRAAIPPQTTVIDPALMTEDGGTTVFTYSPSGLSRWNFPQRVKGGPVAKLQWTLEPASEIRAAAAAIGPRPHNLSFVLTVVAARFGALVTLHDGQGRIHRVAVPIEGARLLPDSKPALWVDDRGGVSAGVLFAEDAMLRRVFLSEISWNGGAPKVTRREPVDLPRASRASSVVFSVTPERPPRTTWVMMLEDGSLLTSLTPSTPYRPHRTPLLPLQLLGMFSATYLLVADPVEFVGFDILR